jgi:hypothetical protein
VCLYWAEKLMNVNCNNLLNIDAFEIGSLKKLINNQDAGLGGCGKVKGCNRRLPRLQPGCGGA